MISLWSGDLPNMGQRNGTADSDKMIDPRFIAPKTN
jgi:hypothetical protein